jgi:hypothetical protein
MELDGRYLEKMRDCVKEALYKGVQRGLEFTLRLFCQLAGGGDGGGGCFVATALGSYLDPRAGCSGSSATSDC